MLAFSLFLIVAIPTLAEIALSDNTVWQTADSCMQKCASSYSWKLAFLSFDCKDDNARCLCDVPSQHSSTVSYMISLCALTTGCKNPEATSVAPAIFSAYCSVNGYGDAVAAVATQTGTGSTVRPSSTLTSKAATGATASKPLATSSLTSSSSSSVSSSVSSSASSSSSSGEESSLSHSDKIAIICAAVGAVVTLMVAVPGFIRWRSRKQRQQAAQDDDSQDHGTAKMVDNHYYNHASKGNYPNLAVHELNSSQPYHQQQWNGGFKH